MRILKHFPSSELITIKNYKDVFCRSHQNYSLQKQSQSLILARKTGTLVYKGAPVCQSFGNEWFYYASLAMNCIYDCEYCYLQGMYPSASLVVFVNQTDFFCQIDLLLAEHPVYLSISYDTDLLALEGVLGFLDKWIQFADARTDLTIEIRSKCGSSRSVRSLPVSSHTILAWTLSPSLVIEACEHRTASLESRLSAIKTAMKRGFPVRLCFDPLIYTNHYKEDFDSLLKSIADTLPIQEIKDISVGVFRISKEYLKQMRKNRPDSPIAWFPFEQTQGVCHFPPEQNREMISYVKKRLMEYVPESKIFIWQSGD